MQKCLLLLGNTHLSGWTNSLTSRICSAINQTCKKPSTHGPPKTSCARGWRYYYHQIDWASFMKLAYMNRWFQLEDENALARFKGILCMIDWVHFGSLRPRNARSLHAEVTMYFQNAKPNYVAYGVWQYYMLILPYNASEKNAKQFYSKWKRQAMFSHH